MQRVVIITGASSGVGAATATTLVAQGHCVVLNARRERELRELAAQLPPERVELLVADCASVDTPRRLVEAAVARFGALDTIINNAGIAAQRAVEDTTEDFLQSVFATNVFAPARLIAAAWPLLRDSKRGVIINVSSMAAVDPFDGFLVYGASKAAIESFTRSTAREGRTHGIESYSIRLGAIETPLLRSMFSEQVFPKGLAFPAVQAAQLIADCIAGLRKHEEGGVTVLAQ